MQQTCLCCRCFIASRFKHLVEIKGPDLARRIDRTVEQISAAVVVIRPTFFSIRQHGVGLLHRPEALGGVIGGIFVRMQRRRLQAKRFFDICQGGGAVESEGRVVICHASDGFPGEAEALDSDKVRVEQACFGRLGTYARNRPAAGQLTIMPKSPPTGAFGASGPAGFADRLRLQRYQPQAQLAFNRSPML
jgi:hypothetical protein